MSLNLMNELKNKYHYGQVTNIATTYMLECNSSNETIDAQINDICISLDSNAPSEIIFSKINSYVSNIDDNSLAMFSDFIFKHVNMPGLNFTRDFVVSTQSEYVKFFTNNIDALATYLFNENQVMSVENANILINQHIKWVTEKTIDDELVINLFNDNSLGLYSLLKILNDASVINNDMIKNRLQTSSNSELTGFVAIYLLNKYRPDLIITNAIMNNIGTSIELSLIDNEDIHKEPTENFNAYFTVIGDSKDSRHIRARFASNSISEFESDFKLLCENDLLNYRFVDVQTLVSENIPNANKVIITPDLIDVDVEDLVVQYERPPFNTQNREISKAEYITELTRILDYIF